MFEDSHLTPRRSGLTLTAMLAARRLAQKPPDLDGRRPVDGFAIDSAQPNEAMDRDDAISVEYKHDPRLGPLTVLHVTIADVASVVPSPSELEENPQLSALDVLAREQGSTKYYRHGALPMFPRQLQDKMSLEHHKVRPGFTISITFDAHCNRVHTELARTRINTHCKSYEQATQHIADSSITDNMMHHIAVLAQNLLKRKPGETTLPFYDARSGKYYNSEGESKHVSMEASSSYLAVQACMIAANEAAAELMSKSNFMFRNHVSTVDQNQYELDLPREAQSEIPYKPGKAEYGVSCLGHFGLESAHYAHTTSPIRRYADLVNQRMMHWSVDVVDVVHDSMMRAYHSQTRGEAQHKERDRPILRIAEADVRHAIWDEAQDLLGIVASLKEVTSRGQRVALETILHRKLEQILAPFCNGDQLMLHHAVKAGEERLHALHVPYKKRDIAQVAQALNAQAHEEERKRKEWRSSVSYDEILNHTLDNLFQTDVQNADDNGFETDIENVRLAVSKRRHHKFADLLEAAAKRGDIDDFFAGEVSRRLHSDDDRYQLERNVHTLLVVAERHTDMRWDRLRKEAFQMLKKDPVLTERVFNYAQQQHTPPRVFVLETSVLDAGNASHPAALVVYNHEGVDYSAPVLDTADDSQYARHRAILTFFRNYGDLAPHEELYTPKMIDLALGRARVKKGERLALLEKLCNGDFAVEKEVTALGDTEGKCQVVLRVVNKQTGEQLEKGREGWPEHTDEYLDKCAKEFIEDRRFSDMLLEHDVAVSPKQGAPTAFVRSPLIDENKIVREL